MFLCERSIGVLGIGTSLGSEHLTNQALINRFDLNITPSDLENKTGIQSRYFLAQDQSVSDLATAAALTALSNAGVQVNDLSRIILATSTPDYLSPSTACVVQHKLGGKGFPCHDASAACTGFIYALDQALRYLHTGDERILVIGVDARSRTLNKNDEQTIGLYGDGAGAVLLGHLDNDDPKGAVASFTYADGSGYDAVAVPSVGHAFPDEQKSGKLQMPSGNRVMKNAIKAMPQVCDKILNASGLTLADVGTFIFHQPNLMLLKAIASRMKIDDDKVVTSFPEYGNTVAASIPLTLAKAFHKGQLKKGDPVLLAAIGAGFTSGAVLLKWNLEP